MEIWHSEVNNLVLYECLACIGHSETCKQPVDFNTVINLQKGLIGFCKKLRTKAGSHLVKRYLSECRRNCGIYAVSDATKQVVSIRELTIFSNLTR